MNAIGLSDEEFERGEEEEEEEGEVDDPLLHEVDLPVFDDERLEEVKELQKDETLREVMIFMRGEKEMPTKHAIILLPAPVCHFL